MYKTIAQTSEYLSELRDRFKISTVVSLRYLWIPSYTTLRVLRGLQKKQIFCWEPRIWGWSDEGQFTGEISP